MSTNIRRIKRRIRGFERWFDRQFGWFFTNGMKRGPRVKPAPEQEGHPAAPAEGKAPTA